LVGEHVAHPERAPHDRSSLYGGARPGGCPLPSGTAAMTVVRVKSRLARPSAVPRSRHGLPASRQGPVGEPWRADTAGNKISRSPGNGGKRPFPTTPPPPPGSTRSATGTRPPPHPP